MRAEPSISPLTLAVCCAVVAGSLALAPGRGPFPVAAGRGADIVALEGDAMNGFQQSTVPGAGLDPDGVIEEAEVLGRVITRPTTSAGEEGASSCTDDCGDAEPPSAVPTGASPSDGTGGEDPAEATGTDALFDTLADGSDSAATTIDSCRSPRAVVARNGGRADVAPPSPCSQGRNDEPCGGSRCDDRSHRTTGS